jgi:putative Holliday junction resolvase
LQTPGCHEPAASRGLQDGAAFLDNSGNARPLKLYKLIVNKPFVPPYKSKRLNVVMQCGSHHRPDTGIHPRRVATGSEYPNLFYHLPKLQFLKWMKVVFPGPAIPDNSVILFSMGRIMAIDYGSKRVGLAVTDSLRLIASGLGNVHSKDLVEYLENYFRKEPVDIIVVGEPRTMQNNKSDSARFIDPFVSHLRKKFPDKKIERFDERFTSAMAHHAMLEGGVKKKGRRDKEMVDVISAIIILQDYMKFIEPR